MSAKKTTKLSRRTGDMAKKQSVTVPEKLLSDLRALIAQSRQSVAQTVNSALVQLYWDVGRRIREDILKGSRAAYGEEIVSALVTQKDCHDRDCIGKPKENQRWRAEYVEPFDIPRVCHHRGEERDGEQRDVQAPTRPTKSRGRRGLHGKARGR